ncbi:peptidase dimerization domain-containing protein [Pseudonocardia sp. GCM10023141]|uniref:peptidase dimerization domain-containing protein n=1 Tax=Pseudonocardia sp. GCM10023141 TaxID=3252653 RepID=UPI00360D7F1C
MKVGLVQIFHALAALEDPTGITVLVTSDEELGSPSSRGLIEREARGARAALVTEASAGGALKISRKGVSRYRLTVRGHAAHAGLEPERGINATVELAHQVLAITRFADPAAGTTVTPTVCSGGTTTDTVPEHAGLRCDVRATTRAEQWTRRSGHCARSWPVPPSRSAAARTGHRSTSRRRPGSTPPRRPSRSGSGCRR